MNKKNPFRIIRITATVVGYVILLAFVVFLISVGIGASVAEYGPHFLWQAPLTFLMIFGFVLGFGFVFSKIGDTWRKLEHKWDRRKQ